MSYSEDDTDLAVANMPEEEAAGSALSAKTGTLEADRSNPVEVLPASFLETAEEAAALEAYTTGFSVSTPSRRSRRKSSAGPAGPVSEKRRAAQRKAKVIIYGGLTLLVLAVLVMASWKLPYLISGEYIWPWSLIFNKEVKQEEIHQTDYKTENGKVISAGDMRNLLKVAKADETYAKTLFKDAQEKHDAGNMNEAIKLIRKARDKMIDSMDKLRENKGPTPLREIHRRMEKLEKKVFGAAAQWPKELTIED